MPFPKHVRTTHDKIRAGLLKLALASLKSRYIFFIYDWVRNLAHVKRCRVRYEHPIQLRVLLAFWQSAMIVAAERGMILSMLLI